MSKRCRCHPQTGKCREEQSRRPSPKSFRRARNLPSIKTQLPNLTSNLTQSHRRCKGVFSAVSNPNNVAIANVYHRHGEQAEQDMLRDVPPFREHVGFDGADGDEDVMRGTSEDEQNADNRHEINQNADLFDDIFGSAPASPALGGQEGSAEVDLERQNAVEHSDIPRLRSTHVTNGYREGIAESKEHSIQEGFDEGYSLGAELGMKAGWCLGVLEGICRALKDVEEKNAAIEKYEKAHEELKMEKLYGKEYFGQDGIWLFEVPGPEDETTFRKVAVAHPVLRSWIDEVHASAKKYGLMIE